MLQRYSTNKVEEFNVVFDTERKEDVFVTTNEPTAKAVAYELNNGVDMVSVLQKFGEFTNV